MTSQSQTAKPTQAQRIDGEMSIYTAAHFKEQLLDRFDPGRVLELDLSDVQELDSAGLQILLMLKREAELAGSQLRLTKHSQAVFDVLELLNMQASFGDPVVIPADWSKP